MPENKKYFNDLGAFANFLPETIKNFIDGKIKDTLGENWENFKIEQKDLESLYEISLGDKAKDAIIRKFNLGKVGKDVKLTMEGDINTAIETLGKILNGKKIDADVFYDFVYNNIGGKELLSKKNLNTLWDYVNDENKGTGAFNGRKFSDFCSKFAFAETPSKELINFMVQNADFSSFTSDQLICNIVVLLEKCWDYRIYHGIKLIPILKDILGGKEPYKKFSEALLSVPDIEDKIKLKNMISSDYDNVRKFSDNLISNNIRIELVKAEEAEKEKKLKFEVKGKKEYSTDELLGFLAKEPGLNQWIKNVFAVKADSGKCKFDKKCTLIEKIGSMESLMSAKVTAIKSFIQNSENKEVLSKKYAKLLNNENLLLDLKLDNTTVKWALDSLDSWFDKNKIIEFDSDKDSGTIAQLKKILEHWTKNVTDDKKPMELNIHLGDFIWVFSKKLNKDDFARLLELDIWKFGKNTINGYALNNILLKIENGNIPDTFLKKLEDSGSVDFAGLWHTKEGCFGLCLFKTIYQLIRTSNEYKPTDTEAQRKAINDVLGNGEKYQWVRDGLKTFFEKANYVDKNNNKVNAKNLNVEEVLNEVSNFKKLLNDCGMELKFEAGDQLENSKLTVQGKKIVQEEPKKEEPKKEEPKKEEPKKNENEKKKSELDNLGKDKDLINFIADYDYKNVTTLAGLKNNVLRAFVSQQKNKVKYTSLTDEDLESVGLPMNVVDNLLFHLPSHSIKFEDENIINQKFNTEIIDELKKLYGGQTISSAGVLYFMAACSEKSLTINQQNTILNLCPKDKNNENKDIILMENDGDKSKSLAKSTFSKALAALESIEEKANITYLLSNCICDNINFEGLNSSNAEEINNFYGIVYYLIIHKIKRHGEQLEDIGNISDDLRRVYVDNIGFVFSVNFQENQLQEAPYMNFWAMIRKSNCDLLNLLLSDEIKKRGEKIGNNSYATKLGSLFEKLKVRIEIKDMEVLVADLNNRKTNESEIERINENEVKPQEIDAEKKKRQNNYLSKLKKILIGLVIAVIAVLALLLGFGVIGALTGIVKTVTLSVGVIAIFAELIYLVIVFALSQCNEYPGSISTSYGLVEINQKYPNKRKELEINSSKKNRDLLYNNLVLNT